jgi:hypothetical protein
MNGQMPCSMAHRDVPSPSSQSFPFLHQHLHPSCTRVHRGPCSHHQGCVLCSRPATTLSQASFSLSPAVRYGWPFQSLVLECRHPLRLKWRRVSSMPVPTTAPAPPPLEVTAPAQPDGGYGHRRRHQVRRQCTAPCPFPFFLEQGKISLSE